MNAAFNDVAPDVLELYKAVAGEPLPQGCEGTQGEAAITFDDGADFLAKELPPPKWIVPGFIHEKAKGDLCGKSKTRKTYLGLQLAVSVAAGRDFLDAYRIDEPHVVAYVNLELCDWNLQERIRAQISPPHLDDETGRLIGGLGIDPETLRGRLFVCNLRGRGETLREGIETLVATLAERKVELVIIDPRYKLLLPGEDENSADGLRGILEFRDRLAERFATLLVTHDPKGDHSQKAKTDRGAGSYVGGADFDFRLMVDLAEGWSEGNLAYVISGEGRARKAPPAVGVRFDETGQVFRPDAAVVPVKRDARFTAADNAERRAAKEATLQKAYRDAAMKAVEEAGSKLLDVTSFDNAVARSPGASVAVNRRGQMRSALVADGTLAVCRERTRNAATGEVRNLKNGRTYISTPARIAAYLRDCESLGA